MKKSTNKVSTQRFINISGKQLLDKNQSRLRYWINSNFDERLFECSLIHYEMINFYSYIFNMLFILEYFVPSA